MKKIISIALFGDGSKKDGSGTNYHRYLPTFVLAHHNLFPASEHWGLHVHVDNLTLNGEYGRLLRNMESLNLLTLVVMGDAALTKAMLWRMAPVFDGNVDYVFCRDIDCIPMPRDRAVCNVFIASNCATHTVHDSQSHVGIMGGLCGFQTSSFKNAARMYSLTDLYSFARKTEAEWAQHGTDQIVLNYLIDRNGGPTLLEHRYNGWHAGPGKFPKRARGEYRTKTWSAAVQDVGRGPANLSVALTEEADLLANHLGAAGYDIDQARMFWTKFGDPNITALVHDSEQL